MIEYDKLNEAYELCKKAPGHTIEITLGGEIESIVHLYHQWDSRYAGIHTIDECIEKLKELSQPKPKYKAGETVWYCDSENMVQECKISSYCAVSNVYFLLDVCNYTFITTQTRIFPTKQDLIQHQVNYWDKLWHQYQIESEGVN